LCVIVQVALWPLTALGLPLSFGPWFMVLELFGQPVPNLLRPYLSRLILVPLYWGFVVLVLRRLWLMAKARSLSAPESFAGVPYFLVLASVVCILLFVLAMTATIVLRAGSGVPAAMLLIPAGFLLSPAIAWVELRGLLPRRNLAGSSDAQ
jgi:hypothetical protein